MNDLCKPSPYVTLTLTNFPFYPRKYLTAVTRRVKTNFSVMEENGEISFSEEGETIIGMLTGVVLQVTTRYKNEYDYDVHVEKIEGKYSLEGGYAIDIFYYLQALLNFTYVLRPEVDGSEITESMANLTIDLYAASYSLIADKARYLEPSFVTGQSRIYAFFDHNFEGGTAGQDIFITPFTPRLWLCTAIMILIFTLTFLLLNQFEKNNSTGDIIFHCISLVLQKGGDIPHFRDSTRLTAFVLSVAILIIMSSYSGIMTSIFAVNRYTINTIEALINSNYKIMIEIGSASNISTIIYMLKAMASMPIAQKLLRKSDKAKFEFVSFNDAMREVKRIPSTYIIDEETGLEAIQEVHGGFPCSWSKASVFNLRYPWCMYMRKNGSFHRAINTGIVRIRERGILRRIRKKWIHTPAPSCYSGSTDYKQITFSQIMGALELFAIILVVICPLLLLGEKAKKIFNSRKINGNENVHGMMIEYETSNVTVNDKLFVKRIEHVYY